MEKYEGLEFEAVEFGSEDVITDSATGDGTAPSDTTTPEISG